MTGWNLCTMIATSAGTTLRIETPDGEVTVQHLPPPLVSYEYHGTAEDLLAAYALPNRPAA